MTPPDDWPHDGTPHFREHATETAAVEHAKTAHREAVAFWSESWDVAQEREEAARKPARVVMAPENHSGVTRPKLNDPTLGDAA